MNTLNVMDSKQSIYKKLLANSIYIEFLNSLHESNLISFKNEFLSFQSVSELCTL